MKKNLSALELHYLLRELDILIDGKVDQIYQPGKKEFLFQFYLRNKGKRLLRISLPNFIYLTEFKQEQKEPLEYCKFLRKYLDNSVLKNIKQIDFERIIEFHFQSKENLILIVELFSKGNLILCRSDYTIMSPLEIQRWASREIKPKVKYKFPDKRFNLLEIKENDLIELSQKTNKDKLVTFLAIDLSLGGEYSEKICSEINIDKNKKPKELEKSEIKKLFSEITKLINKKENIGEQLDKILTKGLIEAKKGSKYKKQVEKINEIIEQQKIHIEELKKEIIENDRKAELIYNNYNLIKNIIDELNEISKEHSWQDIKNKLKNHRIIKEVNPKDKIITIEI